MVALTRTGRVLFVLTMVSVLILPNAAAGGPSGSPSDDTDPGTPAGVVRQDEAAALAHDAALLAKETGYPVADVERALAFQQAFGEFAANVLLSRYSNQISAIWADPMPATTAHVRFIGDVPQEAVIETAHYGLDVEFSGGAEITMEQHSLRSWLAAEALYAAGYRNFVAYSDRANSVIQIELTLPASAAQPDVAEILKIIRTRVSAYRPQPGEPPLAGRSAEVHDSDLALTVITGSDPIIRLQHSRGGNWLRDDGFRECTSGWSVLGPNGGGIITAGHCNGLNQFEQADGLVYGMTWRSSVYDHRGDIDYLTTTHDELPEFYSDATTIRDVTGIRTTNTMVGFNVCVYGRSSNLRTCDHQVNAVDVTATSQETGAMIGSLARVTNTSPLIDGDSGAGWSVSLTAWGVHTGVGGGYAYYTPVQEAQSALALTINYTQ